MMSMLSNKLNSRRKRLNGTRHLLMTIKMMQSQMTRMMEPWFLKCSYCPLTHRIIRLNNIITGITTSINTNLTTLWRLSLQMKRTPSNMTWFRSVTVEGALDLCPSPPPSQDRNLEFNRTVGTATMKVVRKNTTRVL